MVADGLSALLSHPFAVELLLHTKEGQVHSPLLFSKMHALAGAAASASSLQCPCPSIPSCSPISARIYRHGWLVGGGSSISRRFVFISSSPSPSSSYFRPRPITTTTVFCKVPTITQDSFPDEVLKSDSPVLVGFCAEWCGPCKLIGPIMESVAKEFDGSLKAVKIDTDSSPDLVKEYDVYGLPTLILFKDGKEVTKSRREGTINAKKLKELLDELLTSTATT